MMGVLGRSPNDSNLSDSSVCYRLGRGHGGRYETEAARVMIAKMEAHRSICGPLNSLCITARSANLIFYAQVTPSLGRH